MCEGCSTSTGLSRRDFLGATTTAFVGAALPGVATPAAAGGGDPRRVDAICREAWGARDNTEPYIRHEIQRLTIHHSGNVFWRNREAAARIRSIQAGHQAEGWPDIAYHVVIDRHGNIYRARPAWAKGNTRTNYNPRGHLLVMCLGNFSAQDVTKGQLRSLVDVLAWASWRFGVEPRTIHGHRDYASTECPGNNIQRRIDSGLIRRRVRNRLRDGGVRLDLLCGREGRARVEAIEEGRD